MSARFHFHRNFDMQCDRGPTPKGMPALPQLLHRTGADHGAPPIAKLSAGWRVRGPQCKVKEGTGALSNRFASLSFVSDLRQVKPHISWQQMLS